LEEKHNELSNLEPSIQSSSIDTADYKDAMATTNSIPGNVTMDATRNESIVTMDANSIPGNDSIVTMDAYSIPGNESIVTMDNIDAEYTDGSSIRILKLDTPAKVHTRTSIKRKVSSEVTTLIGEISKVNEEHENDLRLLLDHPQNFVVEDHLINIINKEVVINALQQKNADYIQNVMICYLANTFDVKAANKMPSLISYIHKLTRGLFDILDGVIETYSKIFNNSDEVAEKHGLTAVNLDKSQTEFVTKHRNNLKLVIGSNMQNIDIPITDPKLKSRMDEVNELSQQLSQTNEVLSIDKHGLRRRIMTIILSLVNYIFESYAKFHQDKNKIKIVKVNTKAYYEDFKSFLEENSPYWLSQLNIKINKSAMAAFHKKIFGSELVLSFRTLKEVYDLIAIRNSKRSNSKFLYM
jgi:hypothetical protein